MEGTSSKVQGSVLKQGGGADKISGTIRNFPCPLLTSLGTTREYKFTRERSIYRISQEARSRSKTQLFQFYKKPPPARPSPSLSVSLSLSLSCQRRSYKYPSMFVCIHIPALRRYLVYVSCHCSIRPQQHPPRLILSRMRLHPPSPSPFSHMSEGGEERVAGVRCMRRERTQRFLSTGPFFPSVEALVIYLLEQFFFQDN